MAFEFLRDQRSKEERVRVGYDEMYTLLGDLYDPVLTENPEIIARAEAEYVKLGKVTFEMRATGRGESKPDTIILSIRGNLRCSLLRGETTFIEYGIAKDINDSWIIAGGGWQEHRVSMDRRRGGFFEELFDLQEGLDIISDLNFSLTEKFS